MINSNICLTLPCQTPLNMSVDKRAHIIKHAIELFAEKGFEGTSIRDLAQKAEVNIAMVNYYFGSKEKLIETIMEHKASYMKDRIEELEANTSLSEIEKIDALIDDYINRILSSPNFHKLLYKEIMIANREGLHKILTTNYAMNTKNFAAIIERGIKKKMFKKVDPILTVITIIGSISQVMMSKNLCNKLLEKAENNEPYEDELFRKRLSTHIKQLIHAHLLFN